MSRAGLPFPERSTARTEPVVPDLSHGREHECAHGGGSKHTDRPGHAHGPPHSVPRQDLALRPSSLMKGTQVLGEVIIPGLCRENTTWAWSKDVLNEIHK